MRKAAYSSNGSGGNPENTVQTDMSSQTVPVPSPDGRTRNPELEKALSVADSAFVRKVIEVFDAEVRSLRPAPKQKP